MLLNADPLLEEAHARLMRLCWRGGDRVEALRQYERLCIVLEKELAVTPLASTQALYAQIAHSSKWPPAAKSSSSPVSRLQPKQVQTGPSSHRPVPAIGEPAALPVLPFVGRTKELAWLQGQLTGPANHHPLLLIQGESGIRNTRLIQETLTRFCSSWITPQGTSHAINRQQPYHPIITPSRHALPPSHSPLL